MQEEGWVVCRAFRKPSPNQRQLGFEAWNHAYYIRDHNCQMRRPISISDHIGSTSHHQQIIHTNQGSSFYESYGSDQQDLVSNNNFLDSQVQVIELPQLDDSPTTLSPSLAANKDSHFQDNQEYCDQEKSIGNLNQYIEWKNLDNLLASQLTDTITSSYPYQSQTPPPQINYEQVQVQGQEQFTHMLGCFPGS